MKRYLRILLSTILILSLIADSGLVTVASYADSSIRYELHFIKNCRDSLDLKIPISTIDVDPEQSQALEARPSDYYIVTDWSMDPSYENCELIPDITDPCHATFYNYSEERESQSTVPVTITVTAKRALTVTVKDAANGGVEVTIFDMLNELKAYKNLDVYVTGSNSRMLSWLKAVNLEEFISDSYR